jgi:hypothetical protein
MKLSILHEGYLSKMNKKIKQRHRKDMEEDDLEPTPFTAQDAVNTMAPHPRGAPRISGIDIPSNLNKQI